MSIVYKQGDVRDNRQRSGCGGPSICEHDEISAAGRVKAVQRVDTVYCDVGNIMYNKPITFSLLGPSSHIITIKLNRLLL